MGRKATENVAQNTLLHVLKDRPLPLCGKDDKIATILDAMKEMDVWAIAVTDSERRIYGMVTDREIGRRIFKQTGLTSEHIADIQENKELSELTAADIMIADPCCLSADLEIDTALERMTDLCYRYMPVIDEHKKVKGIVNLRELLQIAYQRHKIMISQQKNMLSSFMHHEPYGGAGGFNGWEVAS